ncbi:MAG: hypothetical protein KKB38_20875, partial [Gammaproteobacteria bacterium]|nr:hypothetical protein [Gammaproteobacteria bacterium]
GTDVSVLLDLPPGTSEIWARWCWFKVSNGTSLSACTDLEPPTIEDDQGFWRLAIVTHAIETYLPLVMK